MTVNTTEIAVAQKFLQAFEAYGLSPTEVGASVSLITSLAPRDTGDEFYSDGLRIEIGAKKVVDFNRAVAVNATLETLVGDFVKAAGINPKHGLCSDGKSGLGGYHATFLNTAMSSTREGECRSIGDVLRGLDQIIAAKQPAPSWARSVK